MGQMSAVLKKLSLPFFHQHRKTRQIINTEHYLRVKWKAELGMGKS